jgi:hypothetical protein
LEDGEHAEKHFEGVKIQGEGAAGDEAGAFGVEPLADPVSLFKMWAGYAASAPASPVKEASARDDCRRMSYPIS